MASTDIQPHGPGQHALLSCSGSERWLKCPGSVTLAEQGRLITTDTPAAVYGTKAHMVFEAGIKMISDGYEVSTWDFRKRLWEAGVQAFGKDQQKEQLRQTCIKIYESLKDVNEHWQDKGGYIYSERKYSLSFLGVRGLDGGTADVVIDGTSDGKQEPGSRRSITICDFKNGFMSVWPEKNTQLMMYAAAVLKSLNVEDADVDLVIAQPNCPSGQTFKTWSTTSGFIWHWVMSELVPKARVASSGHGELVPGEEQCRWCPSITECPAIAEYRNQMFSADVAKMTPKEEARFLKRWPLMESLKKKLEQNIVRKLEQGSDDYNGHLKLVQKRSRLKLTEKGLKELELLDEYWWSKGKAPSRPAAAAGWTNRAREALMAENQWSKAEADVWLKENSERVSGGLELAPADDKRMPYIPDAAADAEASKDFGPPSALAPPKIDPDAF